MGGVGVASTEDAYAVFYNPAGMNVDSAAELAVDRQLNAELRLVSYLGATLSSLQKISPDSKQQSVLLFIPESTPVRLEHFQKTILKAFSCVISYRIWMELLMETWRARQRSIVSPYLHDQAIAIFGQLGSTSTI